ncbi:uncharacterized protein PV09_00245 [Verruconis gallopava]|uniref:Uncharacterized protein n=1 Tax=Verruconis gallopava TaxID=253628 RepID=A0A0D2BD19_9PEZI|nr:uncharacterized protein PV09_00245 [Verruconis gallopava]KIW09344.1 hypothetical protein PV09_00245 [Verruconis gallopava]
MSLADYYKSFKMYPASQSYKPYHDVSSEDASDHGEEEAFLEKPNGSQKKQSRYRRWFSRFGCCLINASVASCIFSAITTLLVLVLLLVSTKGEPLKIIKESAKTAFMGHKEAVPLHGHGAHDHGSAHANAGLVSCGSSPAEAKAMGCIFDVMSFAWTPPQCYDHETSQMYLNRNGPWIFYLDHNATQPLEFDTLSEHEVVWTEHSYHIVHCLYAWERGHMAMNKGKGTLIPSELGSIDHTRHCVDLLDDVGEAAAPAKKVNAIAYLVYDSCRELE